MSKNPIKGIGRDIKEAVHRRMRGMSKVRYRYECEDLEGDKLIVETIEDAVFIMNEQDDDETPVFALSPSKAMMLARRLELAASKCSKYH